MGTEVLESNLVPTALGLPPGFELPTAEISSSQYLIENFDHNNHNYQAIRDLGAFAVALLVLDAPNTGRVSLMPTQDDFAALYEAGYGLSRSRLSKVYGGEARLQRELGFYPRGFVPEREELIERFRWIAQHVFRPGEDYEPDATLTKDIISWGTARGLLPSSKIIYRVLDGSTAALREVFLPDRLNVRERYTYLDLYRFGARVIKENGGPPKREEFDKKYADLLPCVPSQLAEAFFGSYSRFWLSFGYVTSAKGMSQQEIEDFAIRRAIATGDPYVSKSMAEHLSKDQKYPLTPIRRVGLTRFKKRVQEGYDAYLQMRDRFARQNVAEKVFQLACQRFQATPEFERWLQYHVGTLCKLSWGSREAFFVLGAIQAGFDLENDDIFIRQCSALGKALESLDITAEEKRFILDLIPRVDTDEMLALV